MKLLRRLYLALLSLFGLLLAVVGGLSVISSAPIVDPTMRTVMAVVTVIGLLIYFGARRLAHKENPEALGVVRRRSRTRISLALGLALTAAFFYVSIEQHLPDWTFWPGLLAVWVLAYALARKIRPALPAEKK